MARLHSVHTQARCAKIYLVSAIAPVVTTFFMLKFRTPFRSAMKGWSVRLFPMWLKIPGVRSLPEIVAGLVVAAGNTALRRTSMAIAGVIVSQRYVLRAWMGDCRGYENCVEGTRVL
jgi:uncharacterized membrane protein YozB (DUF420 family)